MDHWSEFQRGLAGHGQALLDAVGAAAVGLILVMAVVRPLARFLLSREDERTRSHQLRRRVNVFLVAICALGFWTYFHATTPTELRPASLRHQVAELALVAVGGYAILDVVILFFFSFVPRLRGRLPVSPILQDLTRALAAVALFLLGVRQAFPTADIAALITTSAILSIVLGGLFEARVEPEEVAKVVEAGSDLFVFGQAPIDKPIGEPRKVRRLVLKVDGEGAGTLHEGPCQALARNGQSGEVTMTLGDGAGVEETASAEEMEDALKETVDYPISTPLVQALAAAAVGDAATPREKVARLIHFVSEYLEDESVPGFVSMPQILASKRGDCTEHAALFATLAREAVAEAMLDQLVSTEGVWRQTDSDLNGVQDYWTLDVAGFYFWKDENGALLKFIDVNMAMADRVNEEGEVYFKDLGTEAKEGADRWPAADPTVEGWRMSR